MSSANRTEDSSDPGVRDEQGESGGVKGPGVITNDIVFRFKVIFPM